MTRHVVIVRALGLLRDAAAANLKLRGEEMEEGEALAVLEAFVEAAARLLGLQREYLGPDHPDVGTTCLDLAEGVGSLLARGRERLFALGLEGMGSVVEASRAEAVLRKDFRRISEMYE